MISVEPRLGPKTVRVATFVMVVRLYAGESEDGTGKVSAMGELIGLTDDLDEVQ